MTWWTGLVSFKLPGRSSGGLWHGPAWTRSCPREVGTYKAGGFLQKVLPVGGCAGLAHPWGAVIHNFKTLAVLDWNWRRSLGSTKMIWKFKTRTVTPHRSESTGWVAVVTTQLFVADYCDKAHLQQNNPMMGMVLEGGLGRIWDRWELTEKGLMT